MLLYFLFVILGIHHHINMTLSFIISSSQLQVKQKHDHILRKLQSEFGAVQRVNERKYDRKKIRWKSRLVKEKEKIVVEREKWEVKLTKLELELFNSSDSLYAEKKKRRDLVQIQIDESTSKEDEMQNYIETLEEQNYELSDELKQALQAKRSAVKSSARAQNLAKQRLDKWHAERNRRMEAEDESLRQKKIAEDADKVIEKYKALAEESESTKRRLKREWADDRVARRKGGRRR